MQERDSKTAPDLAKAILLLARRLRAARPEGSVALSELSLLGTLHRLGDMPAAKLAAEERLQPQSLTRMLAALEEREMITRRRNAEDRRSVIISLTPAGRSALKRDIAARRAWLTKAMDETINEDERELLHRSTTLLLRLAAADV